MSTYTTLESLGIDIEEIRFPEVMPAIIPYDKPMEQIAEQIATKIGYTINKKTKELIVPTGRKALFRPKDLNRFPGYELTDDTDGVYIITNIKDKQTKERNAEVLYKANSNRLYRITNIIEVSISVGQQSIIEYTDDLSNSHRHEVLHRPSIDMSAHSPNTTSGNHLQITGTFITYMSTDQEYLHLQMMVNGKRLLLSERPDGYSKILIDGRYHSDMEMTASTLKYEIIMDLHQGNILRKIGQTETKTSFENLLLNKVVNIKNITIEQNSMRFLPIQKTHDIAEYIIRTLKEANIPPDKFEEQSRTQTLLAALLAMRVI